MYTVFIRKNETGEIRECKLDLEWGESSEFWWTEGNFGCDCNREICFEKAVGNKRDNDDEIKCGFDGFRVMKIVLADGSEIQVDEVESVS